LRTGLHEALPAGERLMHTLRRIGRHTNTDFPYLSGEKRQPKKGRKPESKIKV
jgi:hypothetical protein